MNEGLKCDECDCVADDDGCDENGEYQEYWLPRHNGVDAEPVRVTLCNACAYLIAEAIEEWRAE